MAADIRPSGQRTEPKALARERAPVTVVGYLVEVAPGEFEHTDNPAEATHQWVVVAPGEYEVKPIGTGVAARTRVVGGSDVFIY